VSTDSLTPGVNGFVDTWCQRIRWHQISIINLI